MQSIILDESQKHPTVSVKHKSKLAVTEETSNFTVKQNYGESDVRESAAGTVSLKFSHLRQVIFPRAEAAL